MKKGVVMSIEKKWAYVFTQGCGLEKVAARPEMVVGQEISLPEKESGPIMAYQRFKPAWAAAGFLLVLVMVLGILVGTGTFLSPVYATISVDVNPSIEMDLNRSLEVIKVRAMNQDAAQLLAEQALEGMNWEEAIMHWTEVVAEQYPVQQRTVLLSAVLPDGAEQLKIRLLAMEEKLQAGALEQAQIRVVYSHDAGVSKTAQKNGLSVGRQMLLNQSEAQQQGWDAETIETAPLGELVRKLLFGEEQDQTGLTQARNRQTSTETLQSGDPSMTGATSQETNRETNRETTGSQQATSGTQQTNRETNRETIRVTTETLSPDASGTQATSRETSRETSPATQSDPSGSTMTSQSGEPGNSSSPSGSTATSQATTQTSGKGQD